MNISRNNNFDLIRLLAAFQVLIWHGAVHLKVFDTIYGFLSVLFHFPGVPVFFTISGFLISYSLERNNFDLKKYFKNRALRIYPALWVCTIITALMLLFFGKVTNIKDFIVWFLAQITFFQFYVSTSLKAWGTGHPNGSLWSIAVELQFYLLLPVVLYFINLSKKLSFTNLLLIGIFLLSILVKYLIQTNQWLIEHQVYFKLLGNTVFYYLHFFLVGIAIYKNFGWIERYIREKVLIWLIINAAYVLIFQVWLKYYLNPYDISIWGIVANLLLSILTISFAFSFTSLSKRLLHENDISYGIYIYHIPIINAMISFDIIGSIWDLIIMALVSTIIAFVSWQFIEKKALKFKF